MAREHVIRVLKRLDVGINVFQPGETIELDEAEDDWGLTPEKLDRLEKKKVITYEER